jgi:hypothetical protein
MGLGERFHLILVHLLLVAVGVQAITPDPQNLASLRALNMLYDITDGSSNPTESPGNLPDEVSGPVRLGQNLLKNGLFVDMMRSRHLPAGSMSRKTRRRARQTEPVRQFTQMEGMLRTHCRLTC